MLNNILTETSLFFLFISESISIVFFINNFMDKIHSIRLTMNVVLLCFRWTNDSPVEKKLQDEAIKNEFHKYLTTCLLSLSLLRKAAPYTHPMWVARLFNKHVLSREFALSEQLYGTRTCARSTFHLVSRFPMHSHSFTHSCIDWKMRIMMTVFSHTLCFSIDYIL